MIAVVDSQHGGVGDILVYGGGYSVRLGALGDRDVGGRYFGVRWRTCSTMTSHHDSVADIQNRGGIILEYGGGYSVQLG